MSKSRLEKFLYALYSLDSSDLPTPLSRIEGLYKCWVTGEEAPTFEPLSRVEKYLMAILGVYDVDSLPNPLSRVEVLLYKLATGDDNLDDIGVFLSEHEELLAEIIRNGGAGGNINIEYVLHTLSTEFNTLYNTAEKPVKSAILKGNTLVNHFDKFETIIPIGTGTYRNICIKTISKPLKPNTSYLFINHSNVGYALNVSVKGKKTSERNVISGLITSVIKFTTPDSTEDFTTIIVYLMADNESELTYNTFMVIEYQEGMENWDIPYFEGMKSVKMPVLTTVGKNLWCGDKDVFIANGIEHFNMPFKKGTYYFTGDVDTVYPDGPTTIVFSNTFTGYEVGAYINDSNSSVTLKEDCNRVKIYTNGWSFANSTNKPQTIKNLMLSNTYPISYKPYKSNILTVNEDVTLRGIGDVGDELNCLTGEVVQRVGEIILNGVENWSVDAIEFTNTCRFILKIGDMVDRGWELIISNPPFVKSNTFRSLDLRTESHDLDTEHLTGWDFSRIILNISKERLSEFSVDALKTYIQKNPITVQYQLATESTKTVDLSVVDQDGNDTKLKTFNDITHVTLFSEGLIPEAELEVATKNEEVLNTLSLEMDDIFTAQTTLEETSNTQSENVDATMIATTEIYEGLL